MSCLFCDNHCRKKFCSNSCCSQYHNSFKNKIDISKDLAEIIDGTLLSDAGLETTSINPRFYFKQSWKYSEYVRLIASKFGLESKIRFVHGKTCLDCRFKTISSPDLLPYYNKWYIDGIKVIPKDLEITRSMLLHEYLGDGYIRKEQSKNGEKEYQHAVLCTDCFAESDLELFIQKLKEVGIESYIKHHKYNPRKHPRVCIRRRSMDKFFEYIGECPVKCFEYKWGQWL
jgi:hypothetical protein